MLIFGYFGDKIGRRKMYGIELIFLIIGTVGVVMSSSGYAPPDRGQDIDNIDWSHFGSMNIMSWLVWWRFISGVGIGGDYPLSAVIVSESVAILHYHNPVSYWNATNSNRFAPTRKRAQMLAATFAMQPFGYTAATIVSLIVVVVVRNQNPEPSARSIDQVWRWVMGLGLIPAAFAVVLRLTIPESPRYTLDVLHDPFKAFDEANRFNQSELVEEFQRQSNIEVVNQFANSETEGSDSQSETQEGPPRNREVDISLTVHDFFWTQGNWRSLAATALAWLLLDFAFYGLGFNSPQTISKIWYIVPANVGQPAIWDTDFDLNNPETGIYTILIQNGVHSLVISSIGAVIGSVVLIFSIDHFNRRRLQCVTFVILGFLFIIIGATFQATVQTQFRGVTITLYCLCQLCFYFGPNTLTFTIPAELFPTKYRSTCHGISAAAGKLGSVIVQLFLAYVKFGSNDTGVTSSSNPHSKWLGWVLLIFAIPMFLGALVTWIWLPDLQTKYGESLKLEELAEGRQRLQTDVDDPSV
jgi:MFS transporter, PHS family, inorganic phosphate transporter